MCSKEETSLHRAYMCCMWYQEIWQRWQCHISLPNLRRYECKEQRVFAHAYGILNRNFLDHASLLSLNVSLSAKAYSVR